MTGILAAIMGGVGNIENMGHMRQNMMAALTYAFSLPTIMALMGLVVIFGSAALQNFVDYYKCEIGDVENNKHYLFWTQIMYAVSLFMAFGLTQTGHWIPLSYKRKPKGGDTNGEYTDPWEEALFIFLLSMSSVSIFMIGWASTVVNCSGYSEGDWNTTITKAATIVDKNKAYLGFECMNDPESDINPGKCIMPSMDHLAVTFLILMLVLSLWSFDQLLKYDEEDISTRSGSMTALMDNLVRVVAFGLIMHVLSDSNPDEMDTHAWPYGMNMTWESSDLRSYCKEELEGNEFIYDSGPMTKLASATFYLSLIEFVFRALESFVKFKIIDEGNSVGKLLESQTMKILIRLYGVFSKIVTGIFMFGFITANSIWVCPAYKTMQFYKWTMTFLFLIPATSFIHIVRTRHESNGK